MKALKTTLGSALSLLILLNALGCTFTSGEATDLDRSANFTQAAQTLNAQLTLAAEGAFPTVTPLFTQTGTSIPVIPPDGGENGSTNGTPEPGSPCDRGAFVADVSIPDGTEFESGKTFVKTWRIRNNGTCTWTPEYTVVFDAGDAMGGPASFPLSASAVPPGEEVDISINLTAPDDPGSHRGDWKLRNPAGQTFGLGTQADASFWVIITVVEDIEAEFAFSNVHDCDGAPTAIFRLNNTGGVAFESIEMTYTDLDNGVIVFGPFSSNGPFMGAASECPPGGDSARPGSTAYIGGAIGTGAQPGHSVEAEIKVCSQEDLSGACLVETVQFEVP